MRNIEVTAKTVDQAIEKGLQMLGVKREDIEYRVISEGSMLKKAVVEIFTFADANEREEYKKNNTSKPEVKLVKTQEEQIVELSSEGVENVTKLVVPFLEGLLQCMEIDGSVSRAIRNGDVVFKVNGNSINNLIGYHGETLEAIQYLVNTIVRNNVKEFHKKVYIDVENYRRKRAETVEQIAEKVAKKVITTKRSFKLEPMNSYERKAIHFALSNVEHISTHSEGVEPNRCLVIDYVD